MLLGTGKEIVVVLSVFVASENSPVLPSNFNRVTDRSLGRDEPSYILTGHSTVVVVFVLKLRSPASKTLNSGSIKSASPLVALVPCRRVPLLKLF